MVFPSDTEIMIETGHEAWQVANVSKKRHRYAVTLNVRFMSGEDQSGGRSGGLVPILC